MKKHAIIAITVPLVACGAPTAPVVSYASNTGIEIKYHAYDSVPTLTAEARDIAVKHCAKFKLFANYQGGNAVNALTTEEVHRFACEGVKRDDSALIAAQSQRPTYVPVNVYNYNYD